MYTKSMDFLRETGLTVVYKELQNQGTITKINFYNC